MLSESELDELIRRVAESLEPERIILFGSYAKGTATIRSDVDLMVVKDTALPMARRADAVAPLLRRYLVPVDVLVYTPEEIVEYSREPLSFLDTVVKTGRTAYDGSV
jgi:predicted nucleotidyltransferase